MLEPKLGIRVRITARAGNRRFWLLRTLRAHTKAPYKSTLGNAKAA
jgi:hypothetical protein